MKILYLANTLDTSSGWGRFSKEIITRVAATGVEVKVLSENGSGFKNEEVMLKRGWRAIYAAIKVRKYIKNEHIDVVHSLEANPYAITADFANIGLNTKHIITATGAYSVRPLHRPLTKFIIKRAYRRATNVLCISKYIEDEIKEQVQLKNASIVTLGVDFNKFSGIRKTSLEPFILSVGNLSYRKGYHVSVAAFAIVAEKIPSIKYYIAGLVDHNTYNKCQQIIKNKGIEDRVVFLGSVDDIRLKELYLSAELFILTSVNEDYHFEGFGLVFLEAASAGLPVVGTRGNGIPDAVCEGVNGFLVDQDDVKQTSRAILKILQNPKLQNLFAEGSIKWAKENSWENVVQKYLEVYGVKRTDDENIKNFYSDHADEIIDKRLRSPYLLRQYAHIKQYESILSFVTPGMKVLDAGCGEGVLSVMMAKKGAIVTGCDLSKPNIEKSKLYAIENNVGENTEFIVGDAEKMPFPDDAFDLVVSSHVLEHLPDFDQGLREIMRVTKKRAIIAIPTILNPCSLVQIGHGWFYLKGVRSFSGLPIGLIKMFFAFMTGKEGVNESYAGNEEVPHVFRFPFIMKKKIKNNGYKLISYEASSVCLPYFEFLLPLIKHLDARKNKKVWRNFGYGTTFVVEKS